MERDGAWAASFDLPYPSAASMLASLPDGTWLAVARHTADDAPEADRFFADLLSRLARLAPAGAAPAAPSPKRAAGLGPVNPHVAAATAAAPSTLAASAASAANAETRLDVTYGVAPASYAIETSPMVRITRNGAVSAEARRGTVLAAFDPWMGREETWVIDDAHGAAPADRRPAIRDGRLLASWVLATHAPRRPPRIPVIDASRVDVRFDRDGAQWFGSGWHGPERSGVSPGAGADAGAAHDEGWFRWTNAPAAHVNVLVSRRQAIRIHLEAYVMTAPGRSNSMKVMWNGKEVEVHPSNDEWTVPESNVRRGLNVLTIQAERAIVLAESIPGGDPRPLGVDVRRLSFQPAQR
jgi:hypothetical protein